MTCFIRIFRVLHTVQSSVFKVLFSVLLSQQQLLKDIIAGCFCQPFFSFSSKLFSSFIDVFWGKFAAVFSGELHHIKALDKSQHLF
jgi:hypothetical protein